MGNNFVHDLVHFPLIKCAPGTHKCHFPVNVLVGHIRGIPGRFSGQSSRTKAGSFYRHDAVLHLYALFPKSFPLQFQIISGIAVAAIRYLTALLPVVQLNGKFIIYASARIPHRDKCLERFVVFYVLQNKPYPEDSAHQTHYHKYHFRRRVKFRQHRGYGGNSHRHQHRSLK